jgi:hypothetical protein
MELARWEESQTENRKLQRGWWMLAANLMPVKWGIA